MLQLVEGLVRVTPLSKWLARLVIDRKLREVDFVAEGDPAPFYMPERYRRR
jgi:hypothetical protein